MKKLLAVLLFLGWAFSGCAPVRTSPRAGEPVAEKPVLATGDAWTFTDRTETYSGTEDGLLACSVVSSRRKVTRYRTADLNVVKDVIDGMAVLPTGPEVELLNFPLFVGKAWTAPASDAGDGKGTRDESRFRIKTYKNVKVKAGSFSAFKIVGSYREAGQNSPVDVVAWYAPDAKTIVKMEETITKFKA